MQGDQSPPLPFPIFFPIRRSFHLLETENKWEANKEEKNNSFTSQMTKENFVKMKKGTINFLCFRNLFQLNHHQKFNVFNTTCSVCLLYLNFTVTGVASCTKRL